jgi:hypothetical protein
MKVSSGGVRERYASHSCCQDGVLLFQFGPESVIFGVVRFDDTEYDVYAFDT